MKRADLEAARDRFFARVEIGEGLDACHVWTGGGKGRAPRRLDYGVIVIRGVKYPAHRIAWAFAHGRLPPKSKSVLHSCDNARCVRGEHLRLGSHADNMRDLAERDRVAKSFGEKNGSGILNALQVADIKSRLSEQPHSVIAREYAVSRSTIRKIRSGQTWAHVTI